MSVISAETPMDTNSGMQNNIQWGSKIHTCLDFEWPIRGWCANSMDIVLDLTKMCASLYLTFEIRIFSLDFEWYRELNFCSL